jgi:hypothetical protein
MLTQIQEEELNRSRSKSFSKEYTKTSFRSLSDKKKSCDGDSFKHKVHKTESDDKLATLKEFRKRNGLFFKYDEKWSPQPSSSATACH